jgi:glutamate racemase
VGIFDSGVGGFTVARAIRALRPEMHIVYYGDSLNAPYGPRPGHQLQEFARNMIAFLLERRIDIIAVGCNSSSVYLGQGELKNYGIPAFDLANSTIDWLRSHHERPERLALLATESTIRSGYYQRKLHEAFPEISVEGRAAPELVPLIESPFTPEQRLKSAVRKYTEPLLEAGIRHIMLSCTHYPLLSEYFMEIDESIVLIDPAECLAQRLDSAIPRSEDRVEGDVEVYSSMPSPVFYRIGERMLGRPIQNKTRMVIVNPFREP